MELLVILVICLKVCGSMPYDDRDVKKMLETQLKGKVKFPSRILDRLDPNCINLINSMLEVDVTKRYNIDKVLKHAWLADIVKPNSVQAPSKPTVINNYPASNKIESTIRRQTFPNTVKQIA